MLSLSGLSFYIIISALVSAGERKTNRIMAAYILMPWLKFWIFSKQTHLDFCPISLLSVHPFLSVNGIPECVRTARNQHQT